MSPDQCLKVFGDRACGDWQDEFPCVCALAEGHVGVTHRCACGFEWDEVRVCVTDERRDHI